MLMKSKKLPKYVLERTSGAYQYKRNVPDKLKAIIGKKTFRHSLGKTYDEMIARLPVIHKKVEALLRQLDGEALRDRVLATVETNFGKRAAQMLDAGDVDENLDMAMFDLGHQLENEQGVEQMVVAHLIGGSLPYTAFSLSEAIALYADYKDAPDSKKVSNQLARITTDLRLAIGDNKVDEIPMNTLTRADANKYRDYLLERIAPNSVTRYINSIRAVINHAIIERGFKMENPFHGLRIKGAGNVKNARLPLSDIEAQTAADVFLDDDTFSSIYLLLRETGCRLAEATGLQVSDVNLQEAFVEIRENRFRSIKTDSSARKIPLSQDAIKSLQGHRIGKSDDEAIFPRYAREGGAGSASAAMLKRFRKVIKDPKKALHSLRHRKKDQLREVGCPEEISKVLLGHSSQDVASRYGAGHSVEVLRDWITKTW